MLNISIIPTISSSLSGGKPPPQVALRSHHRSDFFHNVCVLPVLQLYIYNGITQCVFVSAGILLLSIMSGRFVCVVHVNTFCFVLLVCLLRSVSLQTPQFVYPFSCWWTFGKFFTLMHKAAMNILVQVFVWTYVFIFPGYIKMELLWHGRCTCDYKKLLNLFSKCSSNLLFYYILTPFFCD